jgi:hypothetical protein
LDTRGEFLGSGLISKGGACRFSEDITEKPVLAQQLPLRCNAGRISSSDRAMAQSGDARAFLLEAKYDSSSFASFLMATSTNQK